MAGEEHPRRLGAYRLGSIEGGSVPAQVNPPRVVPKLKVPLQMGASGLATVEQDSDDEVAACVYALLATERGARLEQTDYGVEEATFDPLPLELDEWFVQIAIWEPRAKVRTRQDLEDVLNTVTVGVGVLS